MANNVERYTTLNGTPILGNDCSDAERLVISSIVGDKINLLQRELDFLTENYQGQSLNPKHQQRITEIEVALDGLMILMFNTGAVESEQQFNDGLIADCAAIASAH